MKNVPTLNDLAQHLTESKVPHEYNSFMGVVTITAKSFPFRTAVFDVFRDKIVYRDKFTKVVNYTF